MKPGSCGRSAGHEGGIGLDARSRMKGARGGGRWVARRVCGRSSGTRAVEQSRTVGRARLVGADGDRGTHGTGRRPSAWSAWGVEARRRREMGTTCGSWEKSWVTVI